MHKYIFHPSIHSSSVAYVQPGLFSHLLLVIWWEPKVFSHSSQETSFLLRVLGLPQGLLPVRHPWNPRLKETQYHQTVLGLFGGSSSGWACPEHLYASGASPSRVSWIFLRVSLWLDMPWAYISASKGSPSRMSWIFWLDTPRASLQGGVPEGIRNRRSAFCVIKSARKWSFL